MSVKAIRKATSALGEAAEAGKEAVAKASPTRMELGRRGKARQVSKQVQKRYDKIQAELKYLIENDGNPESIAKRRQSLKDMNATYLINKKPMKEVQPRVPDEMKSDVRAAEKDKQLDADTQRLMDALNKRAPQNKARGGVAKKRTGSMDFRKGGMVISTVDNRKKK